jgi:hypothetical protein
MLGTAQAETQIEWLNGTMHDPMSYADIRKAPEAAKSLAFSFSGAFAFSDKFV